MNFVTATAEGGGKAHCQGLGGPVTLACGLPSRGAPVTLGLRPQHLTLDLSGTTHRVEMTEALGGVSFIHLTAESGEKLVIEDKGDVSVARGSQVGVGFDPVNIMAFDAATEKRLR